MALGDQYFYLNLNPDLIKKTRSIWRQFNLSIGNSIIDIQHVWLIYLINKSDFIANISRGLDAFEKKKELQGIIYECYNYTQQHFAVEEVLIRLIDYKYLIHSAMHRGFLKEILKKLTNIKDSNSMEVNSMANEIFVYLRDWLLEHIAIHDKNFALQLQKMKNGNELVQKWSKEIKETNILNITALQLDLFNIIKEKS